MKKTAIVSFLGFLIIGATACGSGANPSSPSPSTPTPNAPLPSPAPAPAPTPPPSPAPAPSGPFTQMWTGTVGWDGSAWYKFHDLTVPRDGGGTVTLTWGNATVDLDLVVTNVGCTYPYNSSCQVLAMSESLHNMPERLTKDMKAGETYRVWVTNFGEVNQDYRIDVEIR
jgi:hypothetical protein